MGIPNQEVSLLDELKKLSLCQFLRRAGFIFVHCGIEFVRVNGKKEMELWPIKDGTPYTYNFNQGVLVVYDEFGRPHVMRGTTERFTFLLQLLFPDLKEDGHVPHSNDGGAHIRKEFPDGMTIFCRKAPQQVFRELEMHLRSQRMLATFAEYRDKKEKAR